MPNIKSAKKRVKITKTKALRNKSERTMLKTATKKFDAAVASGDRAAAQEAYSVLVKRVDRAAVHGIIHTNCAARKKSQFTKKLQAMA
ncbi:MAG: 30S ribosomal protein S20 [Clostridia bacterium]|nr:30S ribosomal protein S20 [Clostridia bacterium]